MNNIKVTVELCKEDRQRLDELICFAGLIVGELKGRLATEGEDQEAEVTGPQMIQAADGTVKLVKNDHPVDAPTAPFDLDQPPFDPDPAPVEKIPVLVSLPEFQKAVTQAVAKAVAKNPKQKAAAKEIINKYAPSVSEVPEDKRAEVLAKLAQI